MPKPLPPIAEKRQYAATVHGITRQDPYFWLRADNWQDVMQAPETLPVDIRAYIEAENCYFSDAFETPHKPLLDEIYGEIRRRMKEDDSGVPTPHGPYAYNSRMETGKQYPLIVRTPRFGGDETILLDCNAEAGGEGYFGFGGAEHDPHHKLMAWSADPQGSEFYEVRIRDLQTGKDTGEVIKDTAGGVIWSADSQTLYYAEFNENHRPFRIRRHKLGTAQANDEIVFEESDPGFSVEVSKTLSERYIVIDTHDHQTSEVWVIDAHEGGAPRLIEARRTEREYQIDERDGTLYIRTNADGAEDFKIVSVDAAAPAAANWVDLVPHKAGILLMDVVVLKHHLIRLERFEGLPRIVVRSFASGAEETIRFDEEAYSLAIASGYEFDTSVLRFTYSSPTTPSRTYDYDLMSGARTLLKEQEVPSGHNPADYETKRIFAPAADGELVPITLLYRKGLKRDGKAPLLLYGYGAYGVSMPAAFSISALSLVDRGFVYAVAHIRGGMEKGYRWYRLGRREHKANTFSDFIAAAESLIEQGYTSKGRIVAQGGSAGGMLMGVVTNMRPDLWAGVVAQVPFVDVLNTMLDETLPLTPPEWPEWGHPLASAADYARIAAYAPYEQIAAMAYPPIFVTAGLTDPRVTYWEPAKWVAKLRATKAGDSALYLRTQMSAGHQGASGRFDRIKDTALGYAFALSVVGLA